jgi:hypothetical protein
MMIQELRQKAFNLEMADETWIIDDNSVQALGLYKKVT